MTIRIVINTTIVPVGSDPPADPPADPPVPVSGNRRGPTAGVAVTVTAGLETGVMKLNGVFSGVNSSGGVLVTSVSVAVTVSVPVGVLLGV